MQPTRITCSTGSGYDANQANDLQRGSSTKGTGESGDILFIIIDHCWLNSLSQ